MDNLFPHPSGRTPGVTQKNISAVMEIEARLRRQRTRLDRVSDAVTRFAGSIGFITAHVAFFGGWLLLNAGLLPGLPPFDPYPFDFLGVVLGIEAILLSTFVLMSQNRQSRQEDQRAHLDLQISLLAEQESTKMLQMLQMICARLGLDKPANDRELREMIQTTHVEVLAKELERAREEQEAKEQQEAEGGKEPKEAPEAPPAGDAGRGT